MVKVLEAVGVVLLAVVFTGATLAGMLMNCLFVFLPLTVCFYLVSRGVALLRKKAYFGVWNGAVFSESRRHLVQLALRVGLWIVAGLCVQLALVPLQFSAEEWMFAMGSVWGSVVLLCLLETLPRKRVAVVPNAFFALLLVFLAMQLWKINVPPMGKNAVVLQPPFDGAWYVLAGGNSSLVSHHYYVGSQKYALDLILPEDVPLAVKGEKDLKPYASFGQPILAPIDGVVADVRDGLEDQAIGASDEEHAAGNYVTIETDGGIYVLLAHLQKGSVLVAEGDRVQSGQQIGKCGNSGNTTQPHLHIQAMTGKELYSAQSKPVPMLFESADHEQPRFYQRNDVLRGLVADQ